VRNILALFALLFGSPAIGGDLGIYDYWLPGVNAKNWKEGQLVFELPQGSRVSFIGNRLVVSNPDSIIKLMKEQGRLPGRLSLGFSGITPDQIVSFSQHANLGVMFQIFYKASDGNSYLATLPFRDENTSRAFYETFIMWHAGKHAAPRDFTGNAGSF